MSLYNNAGNMEAGELEGSGSPTGPPPTMITALCDMVEFTCLSEFISGLDVGGGGGACAAVAGDDEVVAVDWQGGFLDAFDHESGVG